MSTTYTIGEVAHLVDRKPATVRMWDRDGLLPPDLKPVRDERQRRVWTDQQVTDMKKWIVTARRIPGIGLPGYNPTPEQLKRHLEGQRKPRPAARKDRTNGTAGSVSVPERGSSDDGSLADGRGWEASGSDHDAVFDSDRTA